MDGGIFLALLAGLAVAGAVTGIVRGVYGQRAGWITFAALIVGVGLPVGLLLD